MDSLKKNNMMCMSQDMRYKNNSIKNGNSFKNVGLGFDLCYRSWILVSVKN